MAAHFTQALTLWCCGVMCDTTVVFTVEHFSVACVVLTSSKCKNLWTNRCSECSTTFPESLSKFVQSYIGAKREIDCSERLARFGSD